MSARAARYSPPALFYTTFHQDRKKASETIRNFVEIIKSNENAKFADTTRWSGYFKIHPPQHYLSRSLLYIFFFVSLYIPSRVSDVYPTLICAIS